MSNTRVKISSVVENQLPEFIREEFPLVKEFFSQYYEGVDYKGAPYDILQNIDKYVKVDEITNLKQSSTLSENIEFHDTTITVDSTEGFPQRYGLLQIDDEIITYQDKTSTQFLECSRGFSGITSYKSQNNPEELVFSSSNSSAHASGTKVKNLTTLFLNEFLTKIKKQFSPGFESRSLYSGLNESIFVKQSKDFYSSKGTDNSFKILFRALYNQNVDIIKPREYMFRPSDARYGVTRDVVVESLDGDPLSLVNKTLKQDLTSYSTNAFGSIAQVEKFTKDSKDYYYLRLDYEYNKDIDVAGSVFGQFSIHPKASVINVDSVSVGSDSIDVDSTVGFPSSGTLVLKSFIYEDGALVSTDEQKITYNKKTLTQFLECEDVPELLDTNKYEVRVDDYAYGTNDDGDIVKVRICGSISDLELKDSTYFFSVGDDIINYTLGEQREGSKENDWIFNVAVTYDIGSITQNSTDPSYLVVTKDRNTISRFDNVNLNTVTGTKISAKVTSVIDEFTFIISEQGSIDTTIVNSVTKKLSKVDSSNRVLANKYNANIQNVYFDNDDVYVASPSLPKYQERLDIRDFKINFGGNFVSAEEIDLGFVHPLYTGDSVYYTGVGDNRLDILNGVYFVKKVDDRRIKLAKSRSNIDNEFFVSVTGTANTSSNTLELFDFYNQDLQPQNIIRKISNPVNDVDEHKTLSGSIGVLKNGVEILNYKSKDFVYYGPIEEIEVTSQGTGYDVTNPPTLTISDKVGSGATAFVSVTGSLKEVQVIDPGFDYIQDPVISLSGGNGSGAIISPNLISIEHVVTFNSSGLSTSVDVTNSIIGFSTYHKFRHGEKVIYETFNQQAVAGLVTGSSYYVSVQSPTQIRLYKEQNDAIARSSTYVGIGSTYGVGNHAIKAIAKKKIISSVNVEDEGSGYTSNPTFINTNDLKSQNDVIFADDILKIKNHGYQSGEIIVYSYTGTSIAGLATTSYYVTKIDDDNFKLSQVAVGSTNKDFYYQTKQYVNLTSKGNGIHKFNYEPISITVSGVLGFTTISSGEYQAVLQPKVRGEITSVHMYSTGNAYGSNDIINFNRQPTFRLLSGDSATLIPIISNGRIIEVLVNSPGFNYNSPPELLIEGDGSGAVLTPVVENGSISRIIVSSQGFNYTQDKTSVTVIPAGANAKFNAKIKTWNINLFSRLFESNQLPLDDGVIFNGINAEYGLQYTHVYASRSLRKILKATKIGENGEIITRPDLDSDSETLNQYHSPIIGWAYDGNPIYGPYGYSTDNGGTITRMKSSYILNLSGDRPSGFPNGFFVEDYSYIGQGAADYLDEHNGRYCSTPEYPNGVYAYFATISDGPLETNGVFRNQRKPSFPYIIGNTFKSKPDSFNFDPQSNQDQIDLNTTSWARNTKPYNLVESDSRYDFIINPTDSQSENAEVGSITRGKIESMKILSSGDNYKVNDRVIFDNTDTFGNNAAAKVSEIKGRTITTVSTSSSVISGVQFIPYGSSNEFIGICTLQHNYLNNTPVFVSGVSTSLVDINGFYNIKVKTATFTLAEDLPIKAISGITTTVKVTGDLSSPNILENDVLGIGTEKVVIRKINSVRSEITVEREYDNTVGVAHSRFSVLTEIPRKFYITSGVNTSINYRRNIEVYFDPEKSVGLGTTSGVGITSTIFLSSLSYATPVSIGNSTQTILILENSADVAQYFSGGYVCIDNSTTAAGVASTVFHISKAKIISTGSTSITIDFDSTGLVSAGVTAFVDKLLTADIPTKTIYIQNHGLETGDEISYSAVGAAISVSLNGYSDIQSLRDFSSLYVLKFNNNLIGISTEQVGFGSTGFVVGLSTLTTANTLYFNGIGTTRNHSFKTNYNNVLKASVETNKVTVSTSNTHGLQTSDTVSLNIISGLTTTVTVEYNSTNRRLIINPISFASGAVNTTDNTITISNHDFYTGQKVIYSATSAIGGLTNNNIYFINVFDKNTIRLSETYYGSINKIPEIINLTSASAGKILPINPNIKVYKNQIVNFDLSSTTLAFSGVSAFSFDLFSDSEFKHVYKSDENNSLFEVTKSGRIGIDTTAKVTLTISDSTPKFLYYNLTPINLLNNSQENLGIIRDKEVIDANVFKIEDSNLSGLKTIIGVTTNTFNFFLNNFPEVQSFTNSSDSTCTYTTNSNTAYGPINKVDIQSGGYGYKSIPGISTIISDFGSSALLLPISSGIGSIISARIKDIGYDYSSDKTLRPTSKLPQILKVTPLSEFVRIGISSAGKYYTTAPSLVVIDGILGTKIQDVDIKYTLGETEVSILQNTTTMRSVIPTIIPTKNSNSIKLKDISYNSGTKIVTAGIAVSYSNAEDFPFAVGDNILVENISIDLGTGTGYNSSDYDYKLFPITYVDANIGGENGTIQYYMGNALEGSNVPGDLDLLNSIPSALPEKFFPQFSIQIQKKNFFDREIISSNDGVIGLSKKWDSRNDYLKVNSSENFKIGSIISGSSSKTNGIIEDIIQFDSKYSIDSSSVIKSGFYKNTGFLNDGLQRLSDNDYYQNFAYSLKSIVPLDTWDDAVQTLNHTSGFKKFSDLSIESKDPNSVGIGTTQDGGSFEAINDIFRIVNLNCVSDFDLATELSYNIGGNLVSENVLFNSKILQDYSESVSNRALLIDDISDQFEDRPRLENFAVVEEFDLDSAISRKYITFVQDKRFIDRKQILLVSLLQDGQVGFINQYGRLYTVEDLGVFDYKVEDSKGQLLFYPINYAANDYSINVVSYNLGYFDVDSYSSDFNLGDTVQVKASQIEFASGISTSVVSISSTYRASKVFVQVDSGSNLEFDELTLIHDGTDVSIMQYGQLLDQDTYTSSGLGTFSASITGSNLVLSFEPNSGVAGTITSLRVSIASTLSTGIGTYNLRNSELESKIVSIASTPSPGITTVASYVQENLEEKYNAAYFIVSVEDKTNAESQVVEILTIDDGANAYITEFGDLSTSSGLGTFGVGVANSVTNLHFTQNANIDVEVRVFKHAIGTINPPNSNGIISIDQGSLLVGSGNYIGTTNVNTTFKLYHKTNPIFEKAFIGSASTIVSIDNDTIQIPNHYFVSGEEVEYFIPENSEEDPIGIGTTVFVGIGTTDKLPSTVYIIKDDDRFVRLATSAENALKAIPVAIDITSVGIGSRHKFISKNQNSKSLISIDNVIQSPVYETTIKTSLASTATVYVDTLSFVGVSSFAAGDLIKINNEIMKIQSISGTSVGVLRYRLGTELERHGLGSTITKMKGNYNIVDNDLTFDQTPYGERPLVDPQDPNAADWTGITTHSTFSGRIFIRSGEIESTNKAYYDNIIYDDLANNFNGVSTSFILKSNGQNVSGVQTNNPILLIDNVFQNAQRVDTAVNVVGNYDIDETAGISTIVFLGQTGIQTADVNVSRIPYGGVLFGVGSTQGFGYQPLVAAGATIQVSSSGTITSISIGQSGSGYRSGIQTMVNVYAKNAFTLNNPISIGTAAISNGNIVSIAVTNPTPVGLAFTDYAIYKSTQISYAVGSGSTVFYILDTKDIVVGDTISAGVALTNVSIVGVSSTSIFIGSGSTSSSAVGVGTSVYIKKFATPIVTIDAPLNYTRIPLIYSSSSTSGIGTGAFINIIVGQGSSVIDFDLVFDGYGYKEGEILTVPMGGSTGIPTDTSKPFNEFQIFVDKTYNNEFSAWSLGVLQLIDDISGAFDGSRRKFTLKVDGKTTSFTTRKGSNIDIQSNLIVFINDILQVPGESYTFSGGSVITFIEAPKGANSEGTFGGDTCKILFYKGTKDVDVVDVDILETIKIGDDITLQSDDLLFEEEERLVTLVDSTSSVVTNAYAGPGVTSDPNLQRPVYWCRQTEDKIINGREIGKDRVIYEPIINPLTNIIQNIGLTTSYLYVSSIKPFFNSSKENLGSKFTNKIEIYNPEIVLTSAAATITVSAAGTISNISIANSGRGYSSVPSVIIGEPYGIGKTQRATATATVTSGFVTSITLTNPGAGYSYSGVSNVSVSKTFFGQGWPLIGTDTYDSVRLATDIGSGFDAVADIKVINGLPTEVTIVNSGKNYQVGDVLSVSRIGDTILTVPAQFFVTDVEKPIVFIEPPDVDNREVIDGVTFEGDYGIITGVASTSVGVASTGIVFDLFIPEYSIVRNGNVNTGVGTTGVSGIQTGFYFVVTNSNIGSGVTSYRLDGSAIGIGTSCLDNVYQVAHIEYALRDAVGVGSTHLLRVTVNVSDNNITGLGSSDFFGEFSWGRIYTPTRKNPKEYTSNSFSGIDTSPIVRRFNPLKYELYRL